MVVSFGDKTEEKGISSKPIIDRSCGMEKPCPARQMQRWQYHCRQIHSGDQVYPPDNGSCPDMLLGWWIPRHGVTHWSDHRPTNGRSPVKSLAFPEKFIMSTLEQRWPIRRCPGEQYEVAVIAANVINDDTVKPLPQHYCQHNQWCLNGRATRYLPRSFRWLRGSHRRRLN